MAKREKYVTGKDGYKRHQITYADSTGTVCRKRLVARTDREMDEKINSFNRSIGRGTVGFDTSTTLRQWSEYWLQATKSSTVKATTYRDYTALVNRLNSALGSRTVSSVTPMDLQWAINSIGGMSASLIHKYRNTIKAIFDSAERNGLTPRSPASRLDCPKGTKGTHRALSDDERIICTRVAADHRFGLCAMLMLYAGLRRGEAVYLDVDRDVDFASGTLTVRGACWFDGNTGMDGSTKTVAGERTVSIFAPLLPFLEAHRGHGRAFQTAQNGPVTKTAFRRAWESYLTAVSDAQNGFTKRWPKLDENGHPLPYIDSTIRTHDFRHTFATMLFDAGVDVKTAQYMLGRADVSVTMSIYTHLSNAKQALSIDKARQHFNHLQNIMCKEV